MFKFLFLVFALFTQLFAGNKFLVNVPVADVRNFPYDRQDDKYDKFQETQLLYGAHVVVDGQNINDYVSFVAASSERQKLPEFFIKKSDLIEVQDFPEPNLVVNVPLATLCDQDTNPFFKISLGTRLVGTHLSNLGWWTVKLNNGASGLIKANEVLENSKVFLKTEQEKRMMFLSLVYSFINTPYLWGGTSFYKTVDYPFCGVDCSGLVFLCFKAIGIEVPRNSKDQYIACKKNNKLISGDLIFISKSNKPEDIFHVMIYCGTDVSGEDVVVEAPCTGMNVREISLKEKVGDKKVFFGTFF